MADWTHEEKEEIKRVRGIAIEVMSRSRHFKLCPADCELVADCIAREVVAGVRYNKHEISDCHSSVAH